MTAPVVLKFGSSVLRTADDYALAVHEIYGFVRRGRRVVAVASAVSGTTDRLLEMAGRVTDEPAPGPLAAVLCSGERASAALLALALDAAGVPAACLDPLDAALRTAGPALDAEPVSLDAARVWRALARHAAVVVPGFFGAGGDGAPALLGRGGSDLSAVFLAHALGAAECHLLKDVDGVYDVDPAGAAAARRYDTLSWDDAERLGARVIQAKALRFARAYGLRLLVRRLGEPGGTAVGPEPTRSARRRRPPRPLRVALLGLGAIGLGVYRRLAAMPDRFHVTRVAVRDPARHARDGVTAERLTTDPWEAAAAPCDVVVELMGGTDPALDVIRSALAAGRHVVTANKALLAAHGPELEALARSTGVRLCYGAAVGGAVPVLEHVRRIARRRTVYAVAGTLNGTANYILDRLHEGIGMATAVAEARARGLAEADPRLDLDGSDAAQKLILVARAAFGRDADGLAVRREAIEGLGPADAAAAAARGRVLRLVASVRRTRDGLAAEVRPRAVPRGHFLAGGRGEENRVVIDAEAGSRARLAGKGAGRWPTAEAVVAELLDLWRAGARAERPRAGAAR